MAKKRKIVGKDNSSIGESGYRLNDSEIEQALLTGEHSGLLEDYFGEQAYIELKQMSLEAAAKTRKKGPRVLILPGIMGSKIGKPRLIFDDIIWIDPIDIVLGNLSKLSFDNGSSKLKALGVVLFAYLKIKLFFIIKGYDAEFYPFDWRK
ncbi:MAG: hypothetical protein O7C70_02785, partial [Candidatus Dadabacteria bacterium]|nr:hypothetical protein [Candidatus Dadabacteria bacterium]